MSRGGGVGGASPHDKRLATAAAADTAAGRGETLQWREQELQTGVCDWEKA